jgi:hypothetical protein
MTDVDAPATDKAEEATEAFKDAASRLAANLLRIIAGQAASAKRPLKLSGLRGEAAHLAARTKTEPLVKHVGKKAT